MPKAIPRGITREHILQALGDLDAGVDHPFGQPTRYELVHKTNDTHLRQLSDWHFVTSPAKSFIQMNSAVARHPAKQTTSGGI